MKKIKKIFIFFLFIILYGEFEYSLAKEIKIIKKINNEIITNIDIENEYNYLKTLNLKIKDLKKDEAYIIAENSIIREKIKYLEIKKYYDLNEIANSKIIEKVLSNIMDNLGFENMTKFKDFLLDSGLEFENVKKKLAIETGWNQLIFAKFKDKIKINEEKIINKINYRDFNELQTQYDLLEIVFQVDNKKNLQKVYQEIKENISAIGFANTANKISISDSSKYGGKIGTVQENQLSEDIVKELKVLNNGEYTKPIQIGINYLILFIEKKETIKKEIDKDKLIRQTISYEKERQFQNFSQIYFNKIKINTKIYEN